jgi:sugar phosphate isomerase/epimerase
MRHPASHSRLTFSTLASPQWTLPQIVENAAASRLGGVDFRGIGQELDITQLREFGPDLAGTLELLRKHHLQMPCLNTSVTLVTPALTKWEAMQEELSRYAQLARQCGTRFIRVFGGAVPPDMPREDARRLAVSHLRQAVEICQPHGCRPLLETHDEWTVSSAVLEILGEIDPADAGMLWDLEHPWRSGESPAATAAALGPRIQHVHIKDTKRVAGKSVPMLLGEGEIPLKQCLTALAGIGYTGWICLETEKRWHAEGPEPEQSVPQFAKFMGEIGNSKNENRSLD